MVTLGIIDFTNVTFANNHAAYQAGALHGGGSDDLRRVITLTNTIFLNNTLNEQALPSTTEWQGYHTNRPMTDGGGNIQHPRYKPTYGNDVNNWITTNPIFVDPLLDPLADNGGPSWTMALRESSPAIDMGMPACPPLDQRGYLREGPCDIGAYEYQSQILSVMPAAQILQPGDQVQFTVRIRTRSTFTTPLALSLGIPEPDIEVSLGKTTLLPPADETILTVTDHHLPGTVAGIYLPLEITAAGGGITDTVRAGLFLNGRQAFMPLVANE